MAYRKIKAKKYNGIQEYYNPNSKDKETRSLYFSYRDEFGKNRLVNLKTIDRDEALKKSNAILDDVRTKSKEIKHDKEKFERAKKLRELKVDDLAKIFFENREAKNNQKDLGVYNNRIKESLGKVKIERVNANSVKELVNLLKKTYAPKTVNTTVDLLLSMFSWAVKNDIISKNPISRDKNHPNYIQKEEVSTETGRVLKGEEIERLFSTTKNGSNELKIKRNPRLYLLCRLLYFTGARPDAILSLKVSDINFDTNEVRIKPMKQSSDYMQPLRKEVLTEIKEWMHVMDLYHDGHHLFYPIQSGNKFKATRYEAIRKGAKTIFDKLFNKGRVSAKRKATLYSLRRTSATRVYQSNGLAVASKFLHHSDVRTTMKYLGINEDIKGAIDAL